jgi:uncharacterized protein YndB with AHSA1/START domain
MSKTQMIAEPGKQVIVVMRFFEAPRERVFKAYTNPKLIPQWWGPGRLTTTVDQMDVRPGGVWRFVQRDSHGDEFAFHGVFHTIESPGQIVDTFEFEGTPGHVLLETMTFEDHGNRTKLVGNIVFQSVEDRDSMIQSGMEAGQAESMDRLEQLLAAMG